VAGAQLTSDNESWDASSFNSPSGSDLVTATILRIEKSESGRFLAAFAFEYPVVHLWPVSFPPNKDVSWID
jgi:hypothetical protein